MKGTIVKKDVDRLTMQSLVDYDDQDHDKIGNPPNTAFPKPGNI